MLLEIRQESIRKLKNESPTPCYAQSASVGCFCAIGICRSGRSGQQVMKRPTFGAIDFTKVRDAKLGQD